MKKRYAYTLLQAALLLLLASCTQEDFPEARDYPTQPLAISVTDGGYATPSGARKVRAVDDGYTTEFTAGDTCGLFVTRGWGIDKKMVYANVKLTAETDAATGQLVWKPEAGTTLVGGLENEDYHLYYPYRPDLDEQLISSMLEYAMLDPSRHFLYPLVNDWQVKADQSTHEAYAASDLMTASCTPTRDNGTLRLDFVMSHALALAVIELPKTVYKFTDARVPDYTVAPAATFTGAAQPLRMADGSYRYVLPDSLPTIEGSYDDGEPRGFSITPSEPICGTYKRYKVDGAPTTQKSYTIQRGDYLLDDGHLLPKETALTAEQKAKVAAIVFWTPAETDPSGRQEPASLADDKVMAKDFPHCTHGLAVAMRDIASGIPWQDNSLEDEASVYAYQNSTPELNPSASDYSSIAAHEEDWWKGLQMILGYQNTKVLLAYNRHCDYVYYNTKVVPAQELINFRNATPAPEGSTGWYLPSGKELHMLFCKDEDIMHTGQVYFALETKSIVNDAVAAAGRGETLANYPYWSSTEGATNGLAYIFAIQPMVRKGYVKTDPKAANHYVRAVCAF